jgi:glycosyltransferase involved in cell wall biosynthesis
MGDTIDASIRSVAHQLNLNFEIIIVDDGSTDNSTYVIESLKEEFDFIRYYFLPRDKKRKLGETRNFSIEKSRGEWCIFHIDTDDFIGNHILDFIQLVEALDSGFKRDFLYAGQQIHMARRGFLLSNGPFRNIYRGEDRDLYERLAVKNQWIVIKHKKFIHRLDRSFIKLKKKTIQDVWDQVVSDLRLNPNLFKYLTNSVLKIRRLRTHLFILRVLLTIPALIAAFRAGILPDVEKLGTNREFVNYRERHSKTSDEWLQIIGAPSLVRNEIAKSPIFTESTHL